MSNYDPIPYKYDDQNGTMIPIVRIGPSEFPRLNTFTAPYLPLQFEDRVHNNHYVILVGKVVSLDSLGNIVPSGLALDLDVVAALTAATANFPGASLSRYTAEDVKFRVKNSRGVLALLNEPVVYSMIRVAGQPLPAYDHTDNSIDITGYTLAVTVGNPIGVAAYSMYRNASDVMDAHDVGRLLNDQTQLRHESKEMQNRATVLVSEECLLLPVARDRSVADTNVKGQTLAIGEIDAFDLGGYLTFNKDSDFVPAVLAGNSVAQIERYLNRRIGQVVRKDRRFPKALLDKVATLYKGIPGFGALDAMPGSATNGIPWQMHLAGVGADGGMIQVSLLKR